MNQIILIGKAPDLIYRQKSTNLKKWEVDEWVKFIEIINSSTDITSKKIWSPNFDE